VLEAQLVGDVFSPTLEPVRTEHCDAAPGRREETARLQRECFICVLSAIYVSLQVLTYLFYLWRAFIFVQSHNVQSDNE